VLYLETISPTVALLSVFKYDGAVAAALGGSVIHYRHLQASSLQRQPILAVLLVAHCAALAQSWQHLIGEAPNDHRLFSGCSGGVLPRMNQ
jgi:hypothetical protein